MKNIERANARLEKVQKATGLSEAGKQWLITVLDPMHDEKLRCSGYPDRETGPSVVQTVKQSLNISRPTDAAYTGKTWGFAVFLDDDLVNARATQVALVGNQCYDDTTTVNPIRYFYTGGVRVVSFLNDTVTPFWQVVSTGDNNKLIGSLDVSGQLAGKSRVLSQGVEIVNTTAELYKSGSLCVWEMPTDKADIWTLNKYAKVNLLPEEDLENVKAKRKSGVPGPDVVATLDAAASAVWDVTPPSFIADAMLLQGSQQWDSKLGAYIVQTMNDMNNPPSFLSPISKIYSQDELKGPKTGSPTVPIYPLVDMGYQTIPASEVDGNKLTLSNHKLVPFNRKGIYVTGLTPESTFTLNYNSVLETFPSHTNKPLVVLAEPSPPEDYVALQLYSEIVSSLPVGVRFTDNDFGEWFLGVCDSLVNTAKSIGKPIMGALEGWSSARTTGANNTYIAPQLVKMPQPQQQQQQQQRQAPKIKLVQPPKQLLLGNENNNKKRRRKPKNATTQNNNNPYSQD